MGSASAHGVAPWLPDGLTLSHNHAILDRSASTHVCSRLGGSEKSRILMQKVRQGHDALQLITKYIIRITERVRTAGRAATPGDRRTRRVRFCHTWEARGLGFRPTSPSVAG